MIASSSDEMPRASAFKSWPKGNGEKASRGFKFTYGLKQGKPVIVDRAVKRLRTMIGERATSFANFFENDVALVPAPRSKPSTPGGTLAVGDSVQGVASLQAWRRCRDLFRTVQGCAVLESHEALVRPSLDR